MRLNKIFIKRMGFVVINKLNKVIIKEIRLNINKCIINHVL